MAMTPQQFLDKNMKWFALIFLLLLGFKSVQSCNRNMKLNITSGQYIHQIDSLKRDNFILERECSDTIKKLNFELRLKDEQVKAAEKNANDVKNAVQSVKQNINLNIKGAEQDTSKRK